MRERLAGHLFASIIVIIGLGITSVSAGESTSPTLSVPGPDSLPFCQVQDFYSAYLTTLYLVDPGLLFRQDLGTRESIRALTNDLECEARFVEKKGLTEAPYAGEYDTAAFDRMALPLVFRYRLKYGSIPSREAIRRFIRDNPTVYPLEEYVVGWEILVETDEGTSPTEIQKALSWIEGKLKTEPFPWVAMQYYLSIGAESDGGLGRVTRGQVPDWKFEAFLSAPETAPYFGPVQVPKGYLFGMVQSRVKKDSDPYEVYGDTVLHRLLPQRLQEEIARYNEEQKAALNLEVYSYDHSSSVGLKQIAYRIGDYAPTYDEILKRFPQYHGDPKDPRFYDAMAKHGIDADLILYGPKAEETRQSPEYRFMARAHRNAWLVDRYVKARLAEDPVDEESLRRFYEARATDLFAQPDLVRVLTLKRTRDVGVDSDPKRRSSRQKPDFMALARLRETFLRNPTVEEARRLAAADPRVEVDVQEEAVPEDKLGRVLEMGVKGIPEGGVSPVLVAGPRYAVAKVLSRQPQPPVPLAEAGDKLRFEYTLACKRKILSEIYPKARAETFY